MPLDAPQFSPFGNAEVPQPFLLPAPIPAIDRSIVPDVSVDTAFDRDEILLDHPISESVPALGGLRRAVLEHRIKSAQSKIVKLEETQRVVKHVGEEITSAGSYSKPEDPLRPATRSEVLITKRLERLFKRRRHEQAKSTSLAEAHPWMESVSDDYPGRITERPRLSKAESRNLRKTTKAHRGLGKETHHLDERFRETVTSPSRQAEKIRERRNKLVQRSASIEAAVNKRNREGEQPPTLPLGYTDWDDYIARRG